MAGGEFPTLFQCQNFCPEHTIFFWFGLKIPLFMNLEHFQEQDQGHYATTASCPTLIPSSWWLQQSYPPRDTLVGLELGHWERINLSWHSSISRFLVFLIRKTGKIRAFGLWIQVASCWQVSDPILMCRKRKHWGIFFLVTFEPILWGSIFRDTWWFSPRRVGRAELSVGHRPVKSLGVSIERRGWRVLRYQPSLEFRSGLEMLYIHLRRW